MRPPAPSLALVAFVLAGCGGHGGSASSTAARGRAHGTLKVLWPNRGRLIPSAANSLVVTLSKGGTIVQTQTIARPASGATSTQTDFNDLDVAAYDVAIKAYPNADGSGTAQAAGAGTLNATANGSGTVTVSLGSTVSTVTVTAASPYVAVGAAATLTARAQDAQGNLVLLSAGGGAESLTWSSSVAGTIVGTGPTAVLTGASAGSATVTASLVTNDAGTVKTGSATLTIDPAALSSTPAWSASTGLTVYRTPGVGPDSRLYLTNSIDGSLRAFDTTGAPVWSFGGATFAYGGMVASNGNTVYFSQAPSSNGGKLLALEPTGVQRWQFNVPYGIVSTDMAEAPDGTVYFGNNNQRLYAVTPSGGLRWTASTGGIIQGSRPALGPDGTIYVVTYTGALVAVSAAGNALWSRTLDTTASGVAVGPDGRIYACARAKVYCYDSSGTQQWALGVGANTAAAPAFGTDGTLYVGTVNTLMHAIASTGVEKWTFSCTGFPNTLGLVINGTLYFTTNSGYMYALRPDGTQRWMYNAGSAVNVPVLAPNGTLYVAKQNGTVLAFR